MISSALRTALWVSLAFLRLFSVVRGENVVQTSGALFQNFPGIEITNSCIVSQPSVSASACIVLCKSLKASCKAVSYNSATRRCCLSSLLAYESGAVYQENADSVYFQIVTDMVRYDNWTLVFRALGGSGQEVYPGWTSVGRYDDHWLGRTDMKLGCATMNGSRPCNTLFRSRLLDDWVNLNVQKVRVSVFKGNLQVVNLIFDGNRSGYLDWFSPERVLESPWAGLSKNISDYNSFSLAGMDSRYFFINAHYNGCPGDTGWLAVVGPVLNRVSCPWEKYPIPAILYNGFQTAQTWDTSVNAYGQADVLAVFIQF